MCLTNHGLQFQFQSRLKVSFGWQVRVILIREEETSQRLRFWEVQVITKLFPLYLFNSTTISVLTSLWLEIVKFRSALQPPLPKAWQLVESLLAAISKALPVLSVIFQSLGVWSMLSSPMNSRESSDLSVLKTRTVPLGRGMPSWLCFLFLIWILLLAFMLLSEQPPPLMEMELYFLTVMLYTLGMNSTCFSELSLRVTSWLRVYMWKSENDFQEKVGGASFLAKAISGTALAVLQLGVALEETVLTSPAISFTLAFSYFFPLLLSMVTHPPISAFYSFSLNTTEQSAFHENPVVLQATSQSVVMALRLLTFQLRVGRVKKPSGSEGKEIPSTLLRTSIPYEVFMMQPLLQPKSVPLTLLLVYPSLTYISMLLLMYFCRMALVLMRLASKFCSKIRMFCVSLMALKVTVSLWMLEETSVKQRSLFP